MSLKGGYALSRDMIYNMDWFCNSLCPKRKEQPPCFPSPCCGDKHYEQHQMDVREITKSAEQTTANLHETQVAENTHSETAIGSYQHNQDRPYCCWLQFAICQQRYQTINLYGKRAMKINLKRECCTHEDVVENGEGSQIGKITIGYDSCCWMSPYVSVQDATNTERYRVVPNRDCQIQCWNHYHKIQSPEKQDLADITSRRLMCIGCCHWREAVEINFPAKATNQDKLLLLATVRNYR